jgi:hypothetical protein
MEQLILCAMAMVALVRLAHLAPRRMARERVGVMIRYERQPRTGVWPRTCRYAAQNTATAGGSNNESSHGPKQDGSAMMTHVIGAGATVLLLVAALYQPGIAAAHGSMDMEQDPCVRQLGESLVHFSAYQPQYELNDQYCTEIPHEADTFLVVDLVDPTLRNEQVGMRVMKGNGGNEADGQIVADIRPSYHPDGVLRSEVRLDKGLYTVTIASEKQNLLKRPQYLLRVHMIDYQQLVLSIAGPLIGVLLCAWLMYRLIRSKWLQSWWTAAPNS